MMHVAVSGWLLGAHSGANRRLVALLRHAAPLLRDGERITLLHRRNVALPQLPSRIELREVAIANGPAWRRAFDEATQLPRALREIGATVCDHGFLPAPRVPCALALTIHDTRDADGFGTRPRWLARLALRRAAARAAAIVVPSEFAASRVRAFASNAATFVVPNGVAMPEQTHIDDARIVHGMLLHVGHLEPRKNLDVLVRALALLPKDSPFHVLLVGRDAGTGAQLRNLAAQLGVSNRVQFLGAIDDASLARLYATSAAVVIPSRYEGFGLAALEGLAWGRPTLVANCASLLEVVGDAATLLAPEDAAAWARAFETLDDSERAAMRRRARAEQWSWSRAAESMLTVWRSLDRATD